MGMCYTGIAIHLVDENGVSEYEGLDLDEDYINAPSGEHILIDFAP